MTRPTLTYPVPATASWSARLPGGHVRIGISRGPPRGQPAGYRIYRPLTPGAWFNAVPTEEFCRLYWAQLHRLNAEQVLKDLAKLAGNKIPTLLCFEPPAHSDDGDPSFRRMATTHSDRWRPGWRERAAG